MTKIITVLLTAAFIYGFSGLLNRTGEATDFRTVENDAFKEGEKLTYDIRYGFVTAGVSTIEIPRIKKITGRECYNVKLAVNSLPSFDWIYKVRTRYESYIDKEGLFSWRFEQHIRESKFSADYSAFFDQRRHIAKTTDGEYEIPEYCHDIISAFYYARTLDFDGMEKGDRIHLKNFYDGEVLNLDVVFKGRERITIEAGTFDCVILEPLVVEGGFFKNEGSILLWMSDDDLHVPILIQTKVVIGSIDVELAKYEGLAGEFTSRK